MSLRGHVDRVDKFLLSGWALSETDPSVRPTIEIVQNGRVLFAITPTFPAPQVRPALGLPKSDVPPTYAWRFWLPIANGLLSDVAFTVRFVDGHKPLGAGENRIIPNVAHCDEEVLAALRDEFYFAPSFADQADSLSVWCQVEQPPELPPPSVDAGGIRVAAGPASNAILGRRTYPFHAKIPHQTIRDSASYLTSVRPIVHSQTTTPLRELTIPKSFVDRSLLHGPVPDDARIRRVSGATSDGAQYLIGGTTTFLQLNYLLERYAGRRIDQVPTVVDWGVGCGRVLRNFWETAPQIGMPHAPRQRLIGVDIDDVNVDWCRQHMAGKAEFSVLDLEGFDLPTGSVDFLYGISIFTHLTEHHQHRWLEEIRRVLKPDGVAIVTIHGEGILYRDQHGIMQPFVEKFGFFDAIPDAAIGADRDTYYRATYHSRGYLREHWSRYFEILAVEPLGNAFCQDYVVLRPKSRVSRSPG